MLREFCPCDEPPFICPYYAQSYGSCEWWCGEPDAAPDDWYDIDNGKDDTE